MTIEASGFESINQELRLLPEQNLRLNATLAPKSLHEKIIVVASQLAVKGGEDVLGHTEIGALPITARDALQLARFTPGVSFLTTSGTSFSRGLGQKMTINGARPESNRFVLDGADFGTADRVSPAGATGTVLGLDTISTFQVATSNTSATYGRTSGALVLLSTRSGTNNYHGTAFATLRNSLLDARNFFDGPSVAPAERNQFGWFLGGPLRRSRTFFYGGGKVFSIAFPQLKSCKYRTVPLVKAICQVHRIPVHWCNSQCRMLREFSLRVTRRSPAGALATALGSRPE